jgi:hypothetical protein
VNGIVEGVIAEGLGEAKRRALSIYTFALYYDHESSAISACVDTIENSALVVNKINSFNAGYFRKAVNSSDLKQASLWRANIGRSLSLGNFAIVNAGRVSVSDSPEEITKALLKSLVFAQEAVVAQSVGRDKLLPCCSGPNDEVEYWWSANGPQA